MCRSIKTLRRPEPAATDAEIKAASLQFVRKISGFRQPSKSNQAAFDQAVVSVAEEVRKLLGALPMPAPRRVSSADSEMPSDGRIAEGRGSDDAVAAPKT
jgi:hypothetical protein